MRDNRRTVVAYRRVSTKGQRDRGLGLEAQELAIARHAERIGARVVVEFTEVESGRRSDRPELARALALAKRPDRPWWSPSSTAPPGVATPKPRSSGRPREGS